MQSSCPHSASAALTVQSNSQPQTTIRTYPSELPSRIGVMRVELMPVKCTRLKGLHGAWVVLLQQRLYNSSQRESRHNSSQRD